MRNRSGSAASYTTATSDSGDLESLPSGQSYNSGFSSTSPQNTFRSGASSSSSAGTFSASPAPGYSYSSNTLISSVSNPASALTPIASRMREQDASAMEAYLRRNRSGSGSTDVKNTEPTVPSTGTPVSGTALSSGASVNGDNLTSLPDLRRSPFMVTSSQDTTSRNRVGTHTTTGVSNTIRSPPDSFGPRAVSALRAPPSRNSSLNALSMTKDDVDAEKLTGPPSEYAVFPDPPDPPEKDTSSIATPTVANTPTPSRRLPFNLLSKPLPSLDLHHGNGHRRGASIQSLR